MSSIAIIPARGGSKRIPRKNIKNFLGTPIIAYSIKTALESGLFAEVMVSTDDEEIAQVARMYGANVPFLRSPECSDDFATTVDVLAEVLHNYSSKQNKNFDLACCIYPTAPLVAKGHLEEGLKILIEKHYSSVFPVVAFGYPIWRGLQLDSENKPSMIWPEHLTARSQDLKKAYHDAGQWYWFRPDEIRGSLFTNNSGSIILPEEEVQDIDTITDWKLAEIKYKILHEA